jgi:hypothetical protein
VNLSGSSALSISLEKGEDDTRSRAFQTACCSPGRAIFLEICSFVRGPLPLWRGGRDRECPPDSKGCLETARGVSDLDSNWEQEVSAKSSLRELRDQVECSGFLRFETFTLFLGLSFAGDQFLASCLRSWISQRSSEIILSLSSAREAVDE